MTGLLISIEHTRLEKPSFCILRQKEEQLARVRRQVETLKALIFIICLPEDQEIFSVERKTVERGMVDLQMYFPFVRNLQAVRPIKN